jgi:hypothetical protein
VAARQTFKYFPQSGDPTGLVLRFREADSQSFVAGDLVYLASALLTVCGADPTKILGIALEPATNVTSGHKYLLVQVIRPTDLFSTQFAGANAFAATDQGKGYEIVKTAAGLWEVDHSATTENRVAVQQSQEVTSDGKANPTNGGPILVRFLTDSAAGSDANLLQFRESV